MCDSVVETSIILLVMRMPMAQLPIPWHRFLLVQGKDDSTLPKVTWASIGS